MPDIQNPQSLHSAFRIPHSAFLLFLLPVAVFLVYLRTAAPGAWWGDGLEFACAAKTMGIPHAPGYPFYTVAGHLVMKLLFWLDPGRALTLFGAALLSISIGLLLPLFRRILFECGMRNAECGIKETPGEDVRNSSIHSAFRIPHSAFLLSFGASLLLAFSKTVWDQATSADVHPLTFFNGTLMLGLAWVPRSARPGAGRAAAFGALLGLGLLNHYSILALAPLAALCVLAWTLRAPRARWAVPLVSLLCFALMLTGYLYLPWRAAANPPLNIGDPSTLGRLWQGLRGGQYGSIFLTANPDQVAHGITTADLIAQGIARWIRWWGAEWLPLRWGNTPMLTLPLGATLLALALAGLARLAWRRWELGLGLLGALAATCCYGAFYHISDIEPYFMVALPAAMAGWISLAIWAAGRLPSPRGGLVRGLLVALPVLWALALVAANFHDTDKSWDEGPAIYGQAILTALPKDALVVTNSGDDGAIYSLWYQQMVLGRRPDVTVYGAGFIFQSWYARYFEHPGRPKIPAFVENRPLSQSDQLIFNVKLFRGVLLPNLAQGRRVFVNNLNPLDPFIREYLNPTPVAPLLRPQYYEACTYPFLYTVGPVLYELHPNPGLARLDETALTAEFKSFIALKTGGVSGM